MILSRFSNDTSYSRYFRGNRSLSILENCEKSIEQDSGQNSMQKKVGTRRLPLSANFGQMTMSYKTHQRRSHQQTDGFIRTDKLNQKISTKSEIILSVLGVFCKRFFSKTKTYQNTERNRNEYLQKSSTGRSIRTYRQEDCQRPQH